MGEPPHLVRVAASEDGCRGGVGEVVLRAAFGLLAAAGLLGVVLAIAAAFVQSAALLTAGAEWFGGAATAAAFLWGVYVLWRAEHERTVELHRRDWTSPGLRARTLRRCPLSSWSAHCRTAHDGAGSSSTEPCPNQRWSLDPKPHGFDLRRPVGAVGD